MDMHFRADLQFRVDARWIILVPVVCALVEHFLL